MQNKPQDIGKLHQQFDAATEGTQFPSDGPKKFKCPYEFFTTADRGWIPCDVIEADMEKELVKVIYPHPDGDGWMDVTGAAGIFEDVVQMWRVRLRED